MRAIMIAMFALALSSCWIGEGLFAEKESQRVLEPGIYRSVHAGESAREVQVTLLPNGLTRIREGGEDGKNDTYGFVLIGKSKDRYVAWLNQEAGPSGKPMQIYFLLQRKGGRFLFAMPVCEGRGAEVAQQAGATVQKGGDNICIFRSREGLMSAMLRFEPERDATMELVRVR